MTELDRRKNLTIVEDEASLRFVYEEILGIRYNLEFLDSLSALLESRLKATRRADLAIIDLRLPDGFFVDFARLNPVVLDATPFLVVSSVDDLDILRSCFELGASDYLTKPFKKAELIVKIERILMAMEPSRSENELFQVNASRMTITRNGVESPQLTSKEYMILLAITSGKELKASKSGIVKSVWGDLKITPKTIDVHFFNIRRKLQSLGLDLEFKHPDIYQLKPNS